ncbi:MAG: hypothetical protein N0E56_15825 [Candidatus Thiodiazotropha endolucinida]|nr:hypothetical protein [Candidatus Thiodiazotropha taylori]MCW4268092.1 hypothetical protein [Candidatus Thiodiazotropha endolucinida]
MAAFTADMFAPEESRLTVLSMGLGQDSTALLELYLADESFREKYAPRDFLVLNSDTGDEYPETYEHRRRLESRCNSAGVEFQVITPDMGFHSPSWKTLRHYYKEHQCIGSKAYPKTCTHRLKLDPIYSFLEHWVSQRYGVQCGRKQGLREFAATHGKINVLLGIAKGEEKRVADASKNPKRWFREAIQPVYPLIELGMDRKACQDYIGGQGQNVPPPSNCMCCPFLALEELEFQRRFYPEQLDDWMDLEAAKLEKHRDKESTVVTLPSGKTKVVNKNYGVFGTKPLPIMIEEAKERFSDWSDRRIQEYRFSHGHCVASTY